MKVAGVHIHGSQGNPQPCLLMSALEFPNNIVVNSEISVLMLLT